MRLAAAYFINPVQGYGLLCLATPTISVTYMAALQSIRIRPAGLPVTLVPLHNVASLDMPAEGAP